MILDLQNYLSNPSSGDSLIGNGVDIASGQVLDQLVNQGIFGGPGGAEIPPFAFAKIHTAVVGGTSIALVIQDSTDNVTYTDRLVGPAVVVASLGANATLFNAARIPRSLNRYIRGVYRNVGNVTAGSAISFLVLDLDNIDLWLRKATTTVTEPTGAADEAVAQGILEQ